MLVGLHVATNFQMYRQNSEKALLRGGGFPPTPQGRTQEFFPGGQDYKKYSRENANEGAKRPSGGRVWEGDVRPPTRGSFCIFEIEIE